MKKDKRYSWVKGPLHKPPSKIPPHNDGPYTGQLSGVPGDYMEKPEARKFLDDRREELIGMPHGTDVYGSCALCRNPMYLLPTMLYCPNCKRMLVIETPPNSGRDGEERPPKQSDSGIPEEHFKTPSVNEQRGILDQFVGTGTSDVKGSKT